MNRNGIDFGSPNCTDKLRITRLEVDGGVVIVLNGELNRFTSGLAFDLLSGAALDGFETIWVDATDVASVTRAGARCLIVAAKLQISAGRKFFIVHATDEVRATLAETGFGHLLKISGTDDRVVGL